VEGPGESRTEIVLKFLHRLNRGGVRTVARGKGLQSFSSGTREEKMGGSTDTICGKSGRGGESGAGRKDGQLMASEEEGTLRNAYKKS